MASVSANACADPVCALMVQGSMIADVEELQSYR
jgi:hypothetical protein